MPLDGSRTVLIGYAGEALWHERLLLHDVGNGSWVVLTPDEDMFTEDLSRADSLRICGRNREVPRGIGNGAAWYTAEELEVIRDWPWWFLEGLKMLRDKETRVVVYLRRAKLPSQMRLSYLVKFRLLTKRWSVNGTWIVKELPHEVKSEANGS